MSCYIRKKLSSLTMSSLLAPLRSSLSLISGRNPNFTIFGSKYSSSKSSFSSFSTLPDSTPSSLVGWWAGISEDHKDPYGRIIHISAEQGRYLARSYSPWQLATAKDGTPLFEIYVTAGLEGEHVEQAIYLKHKHENGNEDARGCDKLIDLSLSLFFTSYDKDYWQKVVNKLYVKKEDDEATEDELHEGPGIFDGKQTAVFIDFNVGVSVEKYTGRLNNKLLRVPAVLERKCCFSFCLTVEEDKDQQAFSNNTREGYRCMDHYIVDVVDTLGREKYLQGKQDDGKFRSLILSQAKNQLPMLAGLTRFNRIDIPASSDPLNGLYLGSNGYLVTEVIQIRHKFGRWDENGGIEDALKLESYDYFEAVKLIGDPDLPAGKVAFRAKVGSKYKLPPGDLFHARFGAVARYKGQGRFSGFQDARWVDGEVLILEGEYLKDGFAIGFLYSAPEYQVFKLFKQLQLPSAG